MKKSLVLIGLGARVRDTVLPALSCSSDAFEIVGAYRRTKSELDAFCKAHRVEPLDSLTDRRLESVDYISVCVHPGQLREILRAWRGSSLDLSRATLLVDTPVLSPSGAASIATLKRFKKTLVLEDYVANPVHRFARQLLDEGRIGELRRITLQHSGYRHHAVATCRMLAGGGYPGRIERFALGGGQGEYTLHFGKLRASFVEPRDYDAGSFLLHGTKGTIADYDLSSRRKAGQHLWISHLYEPGRRFVLTLNGEPLSGLENDARLVSGLSQQQLADDSAINILKIRALIDMFAAFAGDDERFDYGFEQGLFDSWSLNVVDRLGTYASPLAPYCPLPLRAMRSLAS